MIAEWVTHGVRIGVEIFAAGFTLLVLAGLAMGFLALGARLIGEDRDDHENDRTRPV